MHRASSQGGLDCPKPKFPVAWAYWLTLACCQEVLANDQPGVVHIAFTPAAEFQEYGYAIRPDHHDVAADGELRLVPSLVAASATVRTVRRSFPPGGQVPVGERQPIAASDLLAGKFAYPIAVDKIAPWGVGLCALEVVMDNGDRSVLWVNITGRSPLTTASGIAGAVLMMIGSAIAAMLAGRDWEERHLYAASLLLVAGAIIGLGGTILLQQFGILQFAWPAVMFVSVGGWGSATAIAHILRAILERTRAAPVPASRPQARNAPSPDVPLPPLLRDPAEELPSRLGFFSRLVAALRFAALDGAGPLAGTGFNRQPSIAHVMSTSNRASMNIQVSVSCPRLVAADTEFTLMVHVPNPILTATNPDSTPRQLTVQLMAPGFSKRPDEHWRRQLEIGAEQTRILGAVADYRLRPPPKSDSSAAQLHRVRTVFSSSGDVLGAIERAVGVATSADLVLRYHETPDALRSGELLAIADILRQVPDETTTDILEVPPPSQPDAPDLTVWIQSGWGANQGELSWVMATPHREIDLPEEPPARSIGSSAKDFARAVVDQVSQQESEHRPGREAFVRGVGKQIRKAIPDKFWEVLRAVGRRSAGPPRLLLMTEEPYVPWELALLPEPLLDARLPGFLGAQVVVGRWLIRPEDRPRKTSDGRPVRPGEDTTKAVGQSWRTAFQRHPPLATHVEHATYICGKYLAKPHLKHAEEEVQRLADTLGGEIVNATMSDVMECLQGKRGDLLHFACHGSYNPLGYEDGLAINDLDILTPFHVAGVELRSPFVFLNACQVGGGAEVLGLHGGMVQAFFDAEGAAVVAPLWSIRDAVSSVVAERFYREVSAGASPAEVLRRIRCEFSAASPGGEPSLTYLAYLFFGHPKYRLTFASQPASLARGGAEPSGNDARQPHGLGVALPAAKSLRNSAPPQTTHPSRPPVDAPNPDEDKP